MRDLTLAPVKRDEKGTSMFCLPWENRMMLL